MRLFDTFDKTDMKIHQAMIHAKREIMDFSRGEMRSKSTKNAAGQISIKADLISEGTFLSTLENAELNGYLYSEESGTIEFGHPKEGDKNSVNIMLDPLDGSQNYVKQLPIGCISVGYGDYLENGYLKDLNKGLILNLYNDELISAKKGVGSFRNGVKLKTNWRSSLNPQIISYYYYSKKLRNSNNTIFTNYATRSLGSSAWELTLVALGQCDAYIDIRGVLKAHDFCGVRLILEEMGAKFKFLTHGKYDGLDKIPLDDFSTGYNVLVANNQELVDKLTEELKKITVFE